MTRWLRVKCRMLGLHRGKVGFVRDTGPFWMCDNCGAVMR